MSEISTEITIPLNQRGSRIGEYHQRAILSDAEVELIRRLYEEGMSYREIAKKFDVSKWTVGRICRYERRNQFAAKFKTITL